MSLAQPRKHSLNRADRLGVFLNGKSLSEETCLREFPWRVAAYQGQKLEYHLEQVRPVKGQNLLEVSLGGRPAGLTGGITIEGCEVRVEYGSYPSSRLFRETVNRRGDGLDKACFG